MAAPQPGNRRRAVLPNVQDPGPTEGGAGFRYLLANPDFRLIWFAQVAAQLADPGSTLHFLRMLIALRKATPALGGRADTRVVCADYPFTYVRGGSHLVVVNPRRERASVTVPGAADSRELLTQGVTIAGDTVTVDGFGYGVFALV